MSMEKVLDLKQRRTGKIEAARALVDKGEGEGRSLTDEETKQYDGLMGEVDALKNSIERQIRLEGLEAEVEDKNPIKPPVEGDPQNGEGRDGFKTFGDFLWHARNKPEDPRLRSGLSEGVDSEGGFLVPEEFSKKLLMDSLETAVIRPNGPTIVPMGSDTVNIPKIVDTAHSSHVFGGVVAYWTEETGDKTVKEPTFGQIKLIAKKLTGYTYASDELLADSAIGLEALLIRLFGEAIGWYEDDAFIDGDGVGKPLGILNSGALLAVNRSAANTIAIADLANIFARLFPKSHKRAIWLANPSTLPQLIALGSTYLTWLKGSAGAAGLSEAPPAVLLGRPIIFTEKCSALGTAGDILLADLSYYLIGDRQRITVASSKHVRFLSDETAWRFVKRVDGQPWVDSAFTPANGSSLSPFVTLYTATTGGD